ncbi:MAG: HEAT repeat domain-containing protein, partial [Myxococcota bacterium]|nr:HEAT repeat domain-containing protein [Myxococcota bacterium]
LLEDASESVRIAALRGLASQERAPDFRDKLLDVRNARLAAATLSALLHAPCATDGEHWDRHLKSKTRAIRRHALEVWVKTTEPPAEFLTDSCPLVRRIAAGALRTSDAAETLHQLLATEPDAETRRAAIASLGQIGTEAAAKALARGLTDSDTEVRAFAQETAESFNIHKNEVPETALLSRRYIAAHQWDKCRALGADAANALIEAATLDANAPRDIKTRLGALRVLAELNLTDSATHILVGLAASDGRIRTATLDTLATLRVSKTESAIRALTSDIEPKVRSSVLKALAQISGLDAIATLTEGLNDPDRSVRQAAVSALGDCSAIDALGAAFRTTDDGLRIQVLAELARTQSVSAIDYAVVGLADSVPAVRQAADAAVRELNWLPVGLPAERPGDSYVRWMTRREWVSDDDSRPAQDILVEGLTHAEPAYRCAAIETLERVRATDTLKALSTCLQDTDSAVRLAAAGALFTLGETPGAGSAWAAWYVQQGEYENAVMLGNDAVEPLTEALKHPLSGERVSAATSLGALGCLDATDALQSALMDPDAAVRAAVVTALAELSFEPAIPQLTHALDDKDKRVRYAAIQALARFGAVVIPTVADILPRATAKGRASALRVFEACATDEHIPTMRVHAISDGSPLVRAAALDALAKQLGAAGMEQYLQALGDRARSVRTRALSHLESSAWTSDATVLKAAELAASESWAPIADLGDKVLPVLLGVLSDPARDNLANRRRTAATHLLGRLKASRALPALHEQLWDLFPDVRIASAEALAAIAKANSVSPLTKALAHPDAAVGRACAAALEPIKGKAAIEALISALESDNPDIRAIAAEALGRRADAKAADPLAELLSDIPQVRVLAAHALEHLGDAAIEPLVSRLQHPLVTVRRTAASLLGKRPAAGPRLANSLADEDAVVRAIVARALRTIGTETERQAVIAAIRDPNSDVRSAALAAAAALGATREQVLGSLADLSVEVRSLAEDILNTRFSAASTAELSAAEAAIQGDPTLHHPQSPRFLAHVLMTIRAGEDFKSGIAAALRGQTQPETLDALAWTLECGNASGVVAARALSHPGASAVWHRIATVAETGDRACKAAALAALAAIDPERGQSAILKAATHPDPTIRATVMAGLQHVPGANVLDILHSGLQDTAPNVRAASATALGERGDPQAAHWLLALLDDGDDTVVDAAQDAILLLRPSAVEALCHALLHGSRYARRFLAPALKGIPAASSSLVRALDDSDWVVRARAAESLGPMQLTKTKRKEAAEGLILALCDSESSVRRAAVQSIGLLGYKTHRLTGALADVDGTTRGAARNSLRMLKQHVSQEVFSAANAIAHRLSLDLAIALGVQGIPLIEHVLMTCSGLVDQKYAALLSLGDLDSTHAAAVLGNVLTFTDRKLRLGAAIGLNHSPHVAQEATALVAACGDTDTDIHSAVLVALSRTNDPRAESIIQSALSHPAIPVRVAAVSAWRALSSATTQPLLDRLSDSDGGVRAAAAVALGGLLDSTAATEHLVRCLDDPNLTVRDAAIDSLGALSQTDAARQALIAMLEHGNVQTRRAVFRVLRDDRDALPQIRAACSDPDVAIRHSAIQALVRLDDRSAIPMITAQVIDSDVDVRAAAVHALGLLGGASVPVLGALADPSTKVRISAADALRRLKADALTNDIQEAAAGLVKRELWHATRRGAECMPLIAHALWTDTTSGLEYRVQLAHVLGGQSDLRAIDSLGDALTDSDPDLRYEAANGLRHAGAKRVEQQLVCAASDADPRVRAAALRSLGVSCPNTGPDTLTKGLADPVIAVQCAAIEALGDAQYLPALNQLIMR